MKARNLRGLAAAAAITGGLSIAALTLGTGVGSADDDDLGSLSDSDSSDFMQYLPLDQLMEFLPSDGPFAEILSNPQVADLLLGLG